MGVLTDNQLTPLKYIKKSKNHLRGKNAGIVQEQTQIYKDERNK